MLQLKGLIHEEHYQVVTLMGYLFEAGSGRILSSLVLCLVSLVIILLLSGIILTNIPPDNSKRTCEVLGS